MAGIVKVDTPLGTRDINADDVRETLPIPNGWTNLFMRSGGNPIVVSTASWDAAIRQAQHTLGVGAGPP